MTQHRRLADHSQLSEIATCYMAVLSIPQKLAYQAEGILVYPGQGEICRVTDAIALWEKSTMAKRLLVAGQNNKLEHVQTLDMGILTKPPYNLRKTDGVVIEQFAEHTGDQSEWAVRMVREHNIASLAHTVPGYHTAKAYLCLLKKLLDAGCRIPVIPKPTIMPPDYIVPEVQATAWTMVPGEVERLIQYQHNGFAASSEELFDYLNWLYRQPIITQFLPV
ncbi:MAG: hypothetical protein WC505_00010 [Patescibacteria group bacterium]